MSEIRYGKSTLPECCRVLAGRLEEPYRGAFSRMYQEYANGAGAPFLEIFIRQMERIFTALPLQKEDREVFLSPFRSQGFQDGQMQVKSLEQSLLQLQDIIRMQNEELHGKCRMAVGLGVMSGLLLIIIMV